MAITTCVYVLVKPEYINQFIEATIENHLQSKKEQGNIRFDVSQDPSNPCRFLLYEAYLDESSAAAHKETAHYQKWRERVAPYMEQPRKGEKYNILAF